MARADAGEDKPMWTDSRVEYPSSRRASERGSAHSVRRCSTVWMPSPQGQLGEGKSGWWMLWRKALSAILPVRACARSELWALSKPSYSRRWLPFRKASGSDYFTTVEKKLIVCSKISSQSKASISLPLVLTFTNEIASYSGPYAL